MRMYHQPCNACISYGLEYDRYAQPFAHRTTECRAVVTDLPSSGVCALNPGGVCCMYCLVVVRGSDRGLCELRTSCCGLYIWQVGWGV
jgi:hypothetical protein